MTQIPVLMVHGFASSFDRNWREPGWVDVLAEQGRAVIGVDLLGHGTAAKPHDPAAYAASSSRSRRRFLMARSMPSDSAWAPSCCCVPPPPQPERFRRIVIGGAGDNAFAGSGLGSDRGRHRDRRDAGRR